MNNNDVTQIRAQELLRFIPIFADSRRRVMKESSGRQDEDGVFIMPHGEYEPDVREFFHLAARRWWCDYSYDPGAVEEMLHDDRNIETADLNTLKTILTYCVRGERFCDGHWAGLLERGTIQKVLRRLEQLLPSLPVE